MRSWRRPVGDMRLSARTGDDLFRNRGPGEKAKRNCFYVFFFRSAYESSSRILKFRRVLTLSMQVVLLLASLLLVEGVSVRVRVNIIVPIADDGSKWDVLGINVTMDYLVAHLNVV